MSLHRPVRCNHELSCIVALVGVVVVCSGSVVASEVISAIPGTARPPVNFSAVLDKIELGNRRSSPAPRQSHGGRCDAGRCDGANCGHGRCNHGACRNDGCEVPGCPAHCPVRPATFGFYDTRWRTWPGHETVQASYAEPAAPVMPPKSEVPTADEESPVPGFEPAETGRETPEPADQRPLDVEPSILPPPDVDERLEPEPPAKPSEAKPSEAKPADDKPAKEKPDDANLFDEADLRRRSQERLALLGQAALQQELLRREALRQQATRLMRPSSTGATVKQATHIETEPSPRQR